MTNTQNMDDDEFFATIRNMADSSKLARDETLPPGMQDAATQDAGAAADKLRGNG
jgi:hypothetical protein